ncbi:MAG: hypothetical protein IPH82_29045 [Chloroflexi bacterium]|nr:hypothetical protein [Chloroflexota bacterium]
MDPQLCGGEPVVAGTRVRCVPFWRAWLKGNHG